MPSLTKKQRENKIKKDKKIKDSEFMTDFMVLLQKRKDRLDSEISNLI